MVSNRKTKTAAHILALTRESPRKHLIDLTVKEITVPAVEPPAPPTAVTTNEAGLLCGGGSDPKK